MRRSLLALALLLALPAYAEDTLVMVVVDGKQTSAEPRMLDPDAVSFTVEEWTQWGVQVPKALRKHATLTPQALGVEMEYDANAAELRFRIPTRLRPGRKLGYVRTLPDKVSPAPKGVMVDYDVAAAIQGDKHRVSVGHVVRTHVAGGVLTTTGQANWVDGKGEYIRGTTTWRRDNLARGTTLQVGDVSMPSNGLNNPTLLGGVRIGTDRYLTRSGAGYDIPLIGGLADTRSTAEVLVNEHQRATGQIDPGPYEVAPSIAVPGLNQVDVIQRDGFGREQIYSRSFYAHPDLLRKGNWEWDITAGAVRTNPQADRYEGFAVQGLARYGLTDRWTLGATVQHGRVGNEGGQNATLHNTVSLGRGGVIQADVSASQRADGARGTAYRVGYERRSENWTLLASHTRKSKDYWEISDLQNSPFKIRSQTSAALAFAPRDQPWRATLSYTDLQYNDDRRLQQLSVAGSYSRGRATWMGGVTHDLQTGDNQAFVGVQLRLDKGNAVVSARSAPNVGTSLSATYSGTTVFRGRDVRYQVGGTWSDNSQIQGRIDTELAGGDLTLEARKTQGQPLLINGRYANSVWIGEGGVINGRGYNPNSSFALVEVPDQAGVDIQGSGAPVPTNKKGYALVNGLLGLNPTTIQLDASQIPSDQQLEDIQQVATPPRQGGAKVAFPVVKQTARQWTVRLGEGYAPERARVVSDTGEVFLLGARGVLVLEQPAEKATLEFANDKCELLLPAEGGEIVCTP
ncbi:MAG: fimbrial biogenesis outer membrane usher protein [Chitinophagaceae bacterium]|nr:MAG: fimbrial biogenesis outer membrane usher protein [Chitinophagaceae bacterium]